MWTSSGLANAGSAKGGVACPTGLTALASLAGWHARRLPVLKMPPGQSLNRP